MLDDCNSSLQCDVFPSKLFSAFLFLIKSTSRRSALCGWAQTTKQPFIHLTFLSFMNRFLGVALNVCLCASLSVCCQNSTNLCRTVTHHREIWKPHHNFYDLFVYRWIYTWITSCRFLLSLKEDCYFSHHLFWDCPALPLTYFESKQVVEQRAAARPPDRTEQISMWHWLSQT